MTNGQQIITIAILALGTILTRFLPFLIFGGRPTPAFVKYLGRVLPSAAIALLVVYCFKDVDFLSGHHGIPELISLLIVVGLHLWKRKTLLSIASGTISYMLLVQFVFK